MKGSEGITRYVVTHINRDGMRMLSDGAQGRYTFATAEEASARMSALLDGHNGDRLASIHGPQAMGTFEVRPCECWPGHFDPKGIYFDGECPACNGDGLNLPPSSPLAGPCRVCQVTP